MRERHMTEKLMGMDDRVWARHANPWSGWTRVATLPLLAVAIWSREWIGWWALVAVTAVALWTWLNPRLFPPPASHDAWMTRGVLGEQVWLKRRISPIAAHHETMARILSTGSALGLLPFAYGLWRYDLAYTLLGLVVLMGGKLWFLDRMVWIYEDRSREVAEADPEGD